MDQVKRATGKNTELSCVKAELARSKTRLTERENQITALIEDGLRVSFEKEVLEKEIADLRPTAGTNRLRSSSHNNFVQGGRV